MGPAARLRDPVRPVSPRCPAVKLMIVDDHRGVRELIRELAGVLATDVREYATGEDALADCRDFQPDMVTVDLRMGGMDGLTTAEMIRARVRSAYVVIVTQFDSAALQVLESLVRLFLHESHISASAELGASRLAAAPIEMRKCSMRQCRQPLQRRTRHSRIPAFPH